MSLLSFAVSLALLVALMVVLGAVPDPALFEGLPWWMYLGGVCGFAVLTGNVLMLLRLGAVQVVVLPAAGQIAMGLLNAALTPVIGTGSVVVLFLAGSVIAGMLADQAGLFGAEKRPLDARRALGRPARGRRRPGQSVLATGPGDTRRMETPNIPGEDDEQARQAVPPAPYRVRLAIAVPLP